MIQRFLKSVNTISTQEALEGALAPLLEPITGIGTGADVANLVKAIVVARNSKPDGRFTNAQEIYDCLFNALGCEVVYQMEQIKSVIENRLEYAPWTEHPAILLPLRLETRLLDNRLLVRIYPDQLLIDTHEEQLTCKEYDSAVAYWRSSRNQPREEKQKAWRKLSAQYGPKRAAFLATWPQTHDFHGPLPDFRTVSWAATPKLRALPDRFLVWAYRFDGSANYFALSNPVKKENTVIASPDAAAEGLFDNKSRWMVDFARAKTDGFAVEIDVTSDDIELGFDRVIATGVKWSNADDGRKEIEQLLEHHRYTSGLAFIEPGTPTNNTEQAPSAFSSKEDHEASYAVEIEGPENWDPRTSGVLRPNANRLSRALGIFPDALRYVYGAGKIGESFAREMNTVTWPVIGDYYLQHLLPGVLNANQLADVAVHFRDFVRGAGPLPSLRIGKQPYGILPVTRILPSEGSFQGWAPWSGDAGANVHFDRALHGIVTRFFIQWQALAQDTDSVPRVGRNNEDPDSTLLRILAMEPRCVTYRARPFVSEAFISWLMVVLRNYAFGPNTISGQDAQSPIECMWEWSQSWKEVQERIVALLCEISGIAAEAFEKQPIVNSFAWFDGSDEPIPFTRDAENANLHPCIYLQELSTKAKTSADTLLAQVAELAIKLAPTPAAREDIITSLGKLSTSSILDFFNHVSDARQIVQRIKDDPAVHPERRGYGVRLSLAKRILRERDLLGGFTSVQQIDAITGVGTDTMHDIVHSFQDFKELPDIDRLFRESLDLTTHRVDAWVTSFATKRLDGIRATQAGETGIHIGSFGYVEDLRPRDKGRSHGYLHAPSGAHAATAAVLYNGFLTHNPQNMSEADDSPQDNPFRINLTSGRVRYALRVMEGVRQGQSLGALLGYQFERTLKDKDLALARYIDDIRDLYPIVARKLTLESEADIEDSPESAQLVAARNVVDGAALARDFRKIRDIETIDDIPDHAYKIGDFLKKGLPDEHVNGLRNVLHVIDDTLDAVGDLLMTESVHQAVQGNFERSAAALEAASGNLPPPELESMATPASGRTLTHRVCVLFNDELTFDNPKSKSDDPRAAAEPRIAHWFSELLEPLSHIGAKFRFSEENGARINVNTASVADLNTLAPLSEPLGEKIVEKRPYARIEELNKVDGIGEAELEKLRPLVTTGWDAIGLDELKLSSTDFLYEAQLPPEGGETGIEQRIAKIVREEFALPLSQYIEILPDQPGSFEYSLADAAELAGRALKFLAAGRPLSPGNLCHPGQTEDDGYEQVDIAALYDRVRAAQDGINQLLSESANLDWLHKAARFGIPGAIPVASDDPHLEDRFENARTELQKRLDTSRELISKSTGATHSNEALISNYMRAMKALFGESFVILPTFVPQHAGDLNLAFRQDVLNGHGKAILRKWFQQVAEVRPVLADAVDLMMFCDAWSQSVLLDKAPSFTLELAQIPYAEGRCWVGLDDWIETETAKQQGGDDLPSTWVRSPLSLVVASHGALPEFRNPGSAAGRTVAAGLLLDEWSELIPSKAANTSVAFHFNAPNTQPPQSILLAVPGTMNDGPILWSPKALADIVSDTMDLAKVRAVDIDALAAESAPIGGIVPGTYLPADPDNPDWARENAMNTIEEWLKALTPFTRVGFDDVPIGPQQEDLLLAEGVCIKKVDETVFSPHTVLPIEFLLSGEKTKALVANFGSIILPPESYSHVEIDLNDDFDQVQLIVSDDDLSILAWNAAFENVSLITDVGPSLKVKAIDPPQFTSDVYTITLSGRDMHHLRLQKDALFFLVAISFQRLDS